MGSGRKSGQGMLDVINGLARRVASERLEAKVDAMAEAITKGRIGSSDEDLLTSKEVAPLLGVSHPKTVEKWVRTKGLPCVRVGRNLRFRRGDVLRWRAQRGEG